MVRSLLHWMKAHPYSYAMFYLVIYVLVFFTLELAVEPKYLVHCPLDDAIPFCQWFVPFYISWLPAFPGSLIFFLLFDKTDFQNLCFVMMNGATFCFLCYILWPTMLDLRIPVEDGNFLAQIMQLLWAIDTPTNVCPSLHVSVSTAIALTVLKSKKMKGRHPVGRWLLALWMVLICISTVFVKQHSVIDVLCGASVTAGFGLIAYQTDWKKLVRKTIFRYML